MEGLGVTAAKPRLERRCDWRWPGERPPQAMSVQLRSARPRDNKLTTIARNSKATALLREGDKEVVERWRIMSLDDLIPGALKDANHRPKRRSYGRWQRRRWLFLRCAQQPTGWFRVDAPTKVFGVQISSEACRFFRAHPWRMRREIREIGIGRSCRFFSMGIDEKPDATLPVVVAS